jgi:hypothetical protein
MTAELLVIAFEHNSLGPNLIMLNENYSKQMLKEESNLPVTTTSKY